MINNLPDIQNESKDFINLPIQKVGVRNIKVPFRVKQKNNNEYFNTIATVSSYCNLSDSLRGINMSRISRTINDVLSKNEWGFDNLNDFVLELQRAHETNNVWIKAKFEYIFKTETPITKIISYEPVQVTFESVLTDGVVKNYLSVETVEMSLCPCSKEMSLLVNNLTDEEKQLLDTLQDRQNTNLLTKINNAGFGAHNQKSIIEVKVELNRFNKINNILWIEDLVDIIQQSVSAPTWSTLKRPDEKYVTEVSYMGAYIDDNFNIVEVDRGGPKFVEDIGRHIAIKLNCLLDKSINDYCVVVNNQESIHSDNIVATSILTANRNLN
jgi:GTP cyclohydrolase IB